MPVKRKRRAEESGKLRIGDDWQAITIIALSQNNPLKAVAEFVENSIDANATNITIVRGKEKGMPYLRITDDGEGVPRDANGIPNFKHVATHICDSIKRQLKASGVKGVQGEFGIGLLSFWTVGEELTMACTASDGRTYEMRMRKGDPGYLVSKKRTLFSEHGTELTIRPLLPGIRHLSGEKIQWYLASELRDRIRKSSVKVTVIDRQARKQCTVEPRQFGGRLLHQLPLPRCSFGDIYLELYLADSGTSNQVGLYRSGTRVLEAITQLDAFQHSPWSEGFIQGIVDVPFLSLTPGTRSGIIHDVAFAAMQECIKPTEKALVHIIEEQKKAEEERASRKILKTIQKAFREALLTLPVEEYDWFDIHKGGEGHRHQSQQGVETVNEGSVSVTGAGAAEKQKQFFEYAGPLYSVRISPSSCVLPVGESRTLRAIARDRSRNLVEHHVQFNWQLAEGNGHIEDEHDEVATFQAASEPGLVRLKVIASQHDICCDGEALITVTESLLPESRAPASVSHGLPGYTYRRAPGELWRSKFDADQNVIVINNGHRDFVYASRVKALKLRYICRLFAKELVFKNFPGYSAEQLLERMVELSLYTEEHLK